VGTVLGLGAGLILGSMILATLSMPPRSITSAPIGPANIVPILLPVVCGVISLAWMQSFAFRRSVSLRTWTLMNAVGWLVGLGLVLVLPAEGRHPALRGFFAGLSIGAAVGAAQSWVLRRLMRPSLAWAIAHAVLLGTLNVLVLATSRQVSGPGSGSTPVDLALGYVLCYALLSGLLMRGLLATLSRPTAPEAVI
jgi:hypothetical protein